MSYGGSRSKGGSVPVFSLYGEEQAPEVEFIHLEAIRTRSERYDWTIDSHLHRGLVQVLFLFGGTAQVTLEARVEEITAAHAVIVPAGTVHSFRFDKDVSEGFVLTLAHALPLSGSDARSRALFDRLFAEPAIIDIGASAMRISTLLEEVMTEIRSADPGHALLGEWLASSVLLLVARARAGAEQVGLDDRRAAIFRRFRDLVEEHFADHWAVNDFARQLHVTESRLDRICRALAGKSAFEMAQDRVMLEARRRLVHLPMPVNALAYELGFEDPAYFCRAFKRCTGLTPSAFRKSQRAQMGLEG